MDLSRTNEFGQGGDDANDDTQAVTATVQDTSVNDNAVILNDVIPTIEDSKNNANNLLVETLLTSEWA